MLSDRYVTGPPVPSSTPSSTLSDDAWPFYFFQPTMSVGAGPLRAKTLLLEKGGWFSRQYICKALQGPPSPGQRSPLGMSFINLTTAHVPFLFLALNEGLL